MDARLTSQLKTLAKWILGRTNQIDYRLAFFDDLRVYLGEARPNRILEIGPKDGHDTRRLLQLKPDVLTLIDLPRMKEANEQWLRAIDDSRIQYISANLMYSEAVDKLEPFDLIWCTGVLYHNPEQLRMIKKLFDLLKPGGVLALESATIRKWPLRRANCVEIIYPPSEKVKKKYHLAMNITHLPSAKAIASWLGMVGFKNIHHSLCHRKMSRALARNRVAYLCAKPLKPLAGKYYTLLGREEGFVIGKAL